jgi:hypothetical protein
MFALISGNKANKTRERRVGVLTGADNVGDEGTPG